MIKYYATYQTIFIILQSTSTEIKVNIYINNCSFLDVGKYLKYLEYEYETIGKIISSPLVKKNVELHA